MTKEYTLPWTCEQSDKFFTNYLPKALLLLSLTVFIIGLSGWSYLDKITLIQMQILGGTISFFGIYMWILFSNVLGRLPKFKCKSTSNLNDLSTDKKENES